MTEEYNFFKDFAGVTEQDLEALRCGGKMKKKGQNGTKLLKKKTSTQNNLDSIEAQLRKLHDAQVQKLLNERKAHPERFNPNGSRNMKNAYNRALDKKDQKGNESYNPYKKKK